MKWTINNCCVLNDEIKNKNVFLECIKIIKYLIYKVLYIIYKVQLIKIVRGAKRENIFGNDSNWN